MRFYFSISGANIPPVLLLPPSGPEQCVWLNGSWFICFGVARRWTGIGPQPLVGTLINRSDLGDPRNAEFHIATQKTLCAIMVAWHVRLTFLKKNFFSILIMVSLTSLQVLGGYVVSLFEFGKCKAKSFLQLKDGFIVKSYLEKFSQRCVASCDFVNHSSCIAVSLFFLNSFCTPNILYFAAITHADTKGPLTLFPSKDNLISAHIHRESTEFFFMIRLV